MGALLTAPCKKGGTKWGLVAHAVAMFTFVTIYTGMTLNIQSISFIDNRNFPGADGVLPPGPVGYQFLIYSKAISIVPNVAFLLNNWLADGLLVSSFWTRSPGYLAQVAPVLALSLLHHL
jgi:hypothetical protein